MTKNDAVERATMTLNLPEREMNVLEEMATRKDMSKTAIMRQALRVYQMCDINWCAGKELAWVLPDGTIERKIVFGCGLVE
jgi:hypothetical protein